MWTSSICVQVRCVRVFPEEVSYEVMFIIVLRMSLKGLVDDQHDQLLNHKHLLVRVDQE